MTTQFPHLIVYQEKTYIIDNIGYANLAKQQDFGMQPSSSGTAMVSGYVVSYLVKDSKIYITNLVLHTKGEYLPINGKLPQPDRLFKRSKYSNLDLELKATGKLLITRQRVNSPIFHPLSYQIVKGLHFQNGHLIEEIDYSQEAKRLRCSIIWRRKILKMHSVKQYKIICKTIPFGLYGYDMSIKYVYGEDALEKEWLDGYHHFKNNSN